MPRMLSDSKNWSRDLADPGEADYRKQSDDFLEALRASGENRPKNLNLKEGAATVFTPEARGSGCSSSAGWRTTDE